MFGFPPIDISHVYHVSPNGDDAHSGLADAYPVDVSAGANGVAKETVQAAVTAASDGDTVLIWPGTYDEEVTVAHEINLMGVHPEQCLIYPSTDEGSALTISDHNVHVSDLHCKGGTDSGACGVLVANNKSGIVLDNVWGESLATAGDGAGLKGGGLATSKPWTIRNSFFEGKLHGAYFASITSYFQFIFENCGFYTEADVDAVSYALYCPTFAQINRCSFYMQANGGVNATKYDRIGLYLLKDAIVRDSLIQVLGSSSDEGDTYCIEAKENAIVSNTLMRSTATGTGTAYSVKVTDSGDEMFLQNCLYDRSGTAGSGNVRDMQDENARVDVGRVGGATPQNFDTLISTLAQGNTVGQAIKRSAAKR